jgi:dihydrofolate synthase/folylpolyglutamate synthase
MVLRHTSTSYPVSDDAARAALAGVYWPGRFDIVCREPLVILDGAHNPAAASELRAELERTLGGRRLTLVFAAMRDKKWMDMWEALRPVVCDVVVTQPTLPRSVQAETLAEAIGRDVPVRIARNPMDAVESAVGGAGRDDAVVVTGSLFLVGEVYPFFLAQWGRRRLFDS